MSICKTNFDKTTCLYFLIQDEIFLDHQKEFNIEPIHN